MERAFFYNLTDTQNGDRNERRYFGSLGCFAWLSDSSKLEEIQHPFTLVVPPLTEGLLHRFTDSLLRLAQSQSKYEMEISLNDWGTLAHCHRLITELRLPWTLAAGVLLAEQHTDPLLARFCQPNPGKTRVWSEGEPAELFYRHPSPSLIQHWRTPGIFGKIGILRELGVRRIELCAQPLPWPEKEPGISVSIYQRALLSVAPCRLFLDRQVHSPDCDCTCTAIRSGMKTPVSRGDQTLFCDHNLIWYFSDNPPPEWADRLVHWEHVSKKQISNGITLLEKK